MALYAIRGQGAEMGHQIDAMGDGGTSFAWKAAQPRSTSAGTCTPPAHTISRPAAQAGHAPSPAHAGSPGVSRRLKSGGTPAATRHTRSGAGGGAGGGTPVTARLPP